MYAANFVITVDSTDSTDSTSVCGTFISEVRLLYDKRRNFVPCAQPLIGRFVTIKRLNTGPQPGSLTLAEVEVNGTTTYGII